MTAVWEGGRGGVGCVTEKGDIGRDVTAGVGQVGADGVGQGEAAGVGQGGADGIENIWVGHLSPNQKNMWALD